MTTGGMVIAGAGEAGVRAAFALRERGWDGAITLIGRENGLPYERPPLSKAVLSEQPCPAPKIIADEAQLGAANITYMPGTTVCEIDRRRHVLGLMPGHREISYGRLLLATGAVPRTLPAESTRGGPVYYLRSFDDALRVRAALRPDQRVLIIGGGFIGLEVAASARKIGVAVTVVEAGPRILGRGVPATLAKCVLDDHVARGVRIFEGMSLVHSEAGPHASRAHLSNGNPLEYDVLIAGIGAAPNAYLAELAGLEIANGIRADACLRTSDPDIFAAGDCCSFPHALCGNRRIRLEAWRNAQLQGSHVAASMLGADVAYTAVPSFWSDQYDRTLLISGFVDEPGSRTVERALGAGATLQFHLGSDDRLLGVSAFGPTGTIARDVRLAERLIERGAHLNRDHLADPEVSLKRLLRS